MAGAPMPAADAAPATPAANAAPGNSSAAANADATSFDAILMLQNLAATPDTLETAELEGEDLLARDEDEEQDDDPEAALAFLSALLTSAPTLASAGGRGDAAGGASLAGGGFAAPDEAALLLQATESAGQAGEGDATQNLARAVESLTGTRPTAATEQAAIATPVRDVRWADEFGTRVSLLVRAGESTASLQMTPVDLGPVEVNVTVKDQQATIHFGASHADTRAAIEASLPRLRELLAAQGFNLLDASVSSGFARSDRSASPSRGQADGQIETEPVGDVRTVRRLGLLDLYA